MTDARVVELAKASVVVERVIEGVRPEAAYDAVSDINRMREWSPEGRGRSAPDRPLRAGDTFAGSNRRGWRKWSTNCTVTRAEAPLTFAFDVSWAGMPVASWGYEFEPIDSGVLVRETWREGRRGARGVIVKCAGLLASGVWNRAEHNAANMRVTLDRLAEELSR